MGIAQLLTAGDAVSRVVALLLLAMSVASWVVIVWKGWLLHRAGADLARSIAAFWQAASLDAAQQRLQTFDRQALLLPLLAATGGQAGGTLAAAGERSPQLTRVLRDALHGVLRQFHFGQTLLATVGATAPFVGLLGTVWGIYQALASMAGAGQYSIDRIAGPVGEALIMTAAGLAVAIPAVLAYNVLGRLIGRIEADLEGFVFDLRALLLASPHPNPPSAEAGMTAGFSPSPAGRGQG